MHSNNSGNRLIVINKWAYIRGWAYIWNEVSVSTCGGLIHGGGLIFGGAYSRRFRVFNDLTIFFNHLTIFCILCFWQSGTFCFMTGTNSSVLVTLTGRSPKYFCTLVHVANLVAISLTH